ncbi:sodium/calcium exchanger regulatory protein 1-like [Eriocheir sinensis]|uniref:sodium/calcium exchanger regulatory protein 1-like n=1 Tax=Eriocheir sinensis TaxID=95602 RepID=UPI0021C821D6|nr:sodium/calcium exchanger regulatory protein 1-like [Eriocheir sinensis]
MFLPGVGIMLRKLGSTAKPTVEFSVNGDEWTFKTISTLKTTEVKFKPGQEVTETTLDGRECKTIFTVEGNKLIQKQTALKGKNATYIREFKDNELVAVSECDGVKSTRVYKRQ